MSMEFKTLPIRVVVACIAVVVIPMILTAMGSVEAREEVRKKLGLRHEAIFRVG